MKRNKQRTAIIIATFAVILFGAASLAYALTSHQPVAAPPKEAASTKPDTSKAAPNPEPVEAYQGKPTTIADTFSIKVPNGWKASVSTSANFLGVMFARPNQLASLNYSKSKSPAIDYDGIPSWGGLTEHFFVIAPTVARQFNPADHQTVTSEKFTFEDGTKGTKYFVTKNATEAQQWGGLQKDVNWHGRTYIYEKEGRRIEAHLALYATSTIDVEFYEEVIRTIQLP